MSRPLVRRATIGAAVLTITLGSVVLSGILGRARSRAVGPGLICAASSVSLSQRLYNVGMSGAYVIYTVRNTGTVPCALSGVPTYSLVDAAGRPALTFTEAQPFGQGAEVALDPGARGSFSVPWGRCSSPQGRASGQTVTSSWRFPGQQKGISRVDSGFVAGCANQYIVASPIQAGAMSRPVGLSAPKPGGPPTQPTHRFRP